MPGEKIQDQLEGIKHLLLQCFYETNSITQQSILTNDEKDPENYNKNICESGRVSINCGRELRFRRADLLSSRTKQAILFLTSECRPILSESGIAFPFTDISMLWIRSIHLCFLRGDQIPFLSKVLHNLPFLEEAKFEDAIDVKDQDVLEFCTGLKRDGLQTNAKSALHSLTFTQKIRSCFDQCWITTYKEIGNLLEYLPYLEYLSLSILNQKLLFSLFEIQTSSVVPLSCIEQTNRGFTSLDCCKLASHMKQLLFLEKLNLSCNPLKEGMTFISNQFVYLRRLQVNSLLFGYK